VRARLEVVSEPSGAAVTLGGRRLGSTPLVRDDLPPGRATITLEKDGFHPESVDVVLAEGTPQRVERRLRSSIVLGKININIEDSWADVTEAGRAVGRAPGSFKLPVGRHSLRLVNPATGKQRSVSVEVRADRVEVYSFEL
jgi:hypothetical protein